MACEFFHNNRYLIEFGSRDHGGTISLKSRIINGVKKSVQGQTNINLTVKQRRMSGAPRGTGVAGTVASVPTVFKIDKIPDLSGMNPKKKIEKECWRESL